MRTTIVSVAELAAHSSWRVVDCSHAIGDPQAGATAYAKAHIPGAVHARMEHALSGPRTGANGRNPLPAPAAFARWLGEMGIGPTDQVVAYDRSGNAAASRLWWMLRWIGHDAVAVLDGGFAAWTGAGQPVTDAVPTPRPAAYEPRPQAGRHVDLAFVASRCHDPDVLIVDARSRDRFHGIGETTDPRAGHIPGSVSRPYTVNVGPDGRFKSAEALAAEWRTLLGDRPRGTLVMSCGSGVSACHNLLSLEIAGIGGAMLYPGSWSEWCSDPSRPIET